MRITTAVFMRNYKPYPGPLLGMPQQLGLTERGDGTGESRWNHYYQAAQHESADSYGGGFLTQGDFGDGSTRWTSEQFLGVEHLHMLLLEWGRRG